MGSWFPQDCKHGATGIAGGCEYCFNESQHLTAVSHVRVGLEQAVSIVEDRAANAFLKGNDSLAQGLRELRDILGVEVEKQKTKHRQILKEQGL